MINITEQSLENIVEIESKRMVRTEKVMVTSDYHIPFMDKQAYSLMRKFAKDYKPNHFIINGDFMDFYSISKYDKNPERKIGIKEELFEGRKVLADLKEILPDKCQMYFLEGNHPLVKDTEILTTNGWKDIVEVSNEDELGQFNIDSGEVSFSPFIEKQSYYSDEVFKIGNNYTEQVVSRKHNVVIGNKKYSAEHLFENQGLLDKHKFRCFGNRNINPFELSDDEIRLLTWVVMDATIINYAKYNPKSKKRVIQFKLSKQRKIDELRRLLTSRDIPFTFRKATKGGLNKLQPYYIKIFGDEARKIFYQLKDKKQLPSDWINFDKSQTKILLETISITDGSKQFNGFGWTSIDLENIELVNRLCTLNGFYSKVKHNSRTGSFKNSKLLHRLDYYIDNPPMLQEIKIEKQDYNDEVFCFTMPEGTLITRHNGKIAFTGNCTRLQNYLWRNTELFGLDELKVENMLNLKKIGVDFLGVDGDYWKVDNGHLKIGDILIMHGDNRLNGAKGGINGGYNTMKSMGCSTIVGHSHKLSYRTYNSPYAHWVALECGNLCQKTGTADWQQGFVSFEVSKGKSYNHTTHRITEEGLRTFNKHYKVKRK